MKGLFMVFHGMAAHSGISKKIAYQCDALERCGVPVTLCHLEVTAEGSRRRMAGDDVIADFGGGLRGKLSHQLRFDDITRYILTRGIDFVYIRYDHNASPFTLVWMRALRRTGVRIALEIPTYPYDPEYKGADLRMSVKIRVDRLFRKCLMRYVDRIVTFSDDDRIFGRPTIRISNGIDFNAVQLKTRSEEPSGALRLLGVANIHPWHGFDRVIAGLAEYYRTPQSRIVRFSIVGDGEAPLLDEYQRLIHENGLEPYVRLAGPLSGAALDAAFEQCDMGIASLGRHRNGITTIKTLKNREYAARGIPFVYSETDTDFDTQPYVLKAPADDTPLDIAALVRFYDSVHLSPAEIRATVEQTLSWERQMEIVVSTMQNLPENR